MDNIDEKIEEVIAKWVTDNKKTCMNNFFDKFYDIYDDYLVEVTKCKKVEEYIALEDKLIGKTNISKPGKIPIRLNKPETKVPAVYYFVSLFLTKWAGQAVSRIVDDMLNSGAEIMRRDERIKMKHREIVENHKIREKNFADSSLTNGLMITELENRIRNLEADVTAKERIILEKNEEINILWEKIKELEGKKDKSACQEPDMDLDKVQKKKKKRPNKKRKRARTQQVGNGMICKYKTDLGVTDDSKKEYLEKHCAEKSRDITFYDIPAYWSDEEIFDLLRTNVGCVEYMSTKRCYKYKTVKVTLRFHNNYEKIYKEGGVNVSLTRNGRIYFLRMFDSRLSYDEIKRKFRWQACKQIEQDSDRDDITLIKDFVKTYRAFYGKIVRVKGKRFIILYFNKEDDLMKAVTDSLKVYDLELALLIKRESDFINDKGELQGRDERSNSERKLSRSNSLWAEREQQGEASTSLAPQRRHNYRR
ncbi:hypothetical protein RhiirA4_481387 [Rhizophagus irregularis]|uniref:Uncharacterized protein n=1 Tax=Rhizophagus irregularis TaxID=588596 RepID=A0A2I1HJD3_9GLOM|nr:hypothetical protein RhiirA4_481387 [Rhizophagus irregularis]